MHFLNYYNKKILKYDLVNKFFLNKTTTLPNFKKTILSFNLTKKHDVKTLAKSLLAIEVITGQKSFITKSKKANILLKIRKGSPVGCKVTLSKHKTQIFIFKLINEMMPKVLNFSNSSLISDFYSFSILDVLNFYELEKHYYLFFNLPKLNVTIVFSNSYYKTTNFILQSVKLKQNSKYNLIGIV